MQRSVWRPALAYHKPADRPESERQHLAGRLPAELPRFRWRDEATPEKPRVLIQTEQGEIELELDAQRSNHRSEFPGIRPRRLYNDGRFFRTVTLANQPTDAVKIEVIQAQAIRPRKVNSAPRFLGTDSRHGIEARGRHRVDGPAWTGHRPGPFLHCVGAQPELDFGGKRNPDGQGFAAFGRVVKGMDVVRRLRGPRRRPDATIAGADPTRDPVELK